MKIFKPISDRAVSITHNQRQLFDKKRIRFLIALLMTLAVLTAIPVYAWFSRQRKAAELFKVNYPNALYINAAQREDQVEFELGGININAYLTNENGQFVNAEGTVVEEPIKIQKKQYVFSVSGSNADKYILQMAHTTNNLFTYKIYAATPQPRKPDSGEYVEFISNPNAHTENPLFVIGDDVVKKENDVKKTYYYVKGTEIEGAYKNLKVEDVVAKDAADDNKYYPKSFKENNVVNDNVEAHAVPLYWQKEITGLKSQWDANKRFCNYYILEVTWGNREGHTIEDKETDLIYFSVKRTG